MRVGIVILPELPWRQECERWQRAEQYGFNHAWTYDQLGWRNLVDKPWYSAIVTLTAAALNTSSIRIGTHVASANFRHPVIFAREATALDDVSGGRLILGLGAGGPSFDARVLGQPVMSRGERASRFAEFVTLLDLVLCSRSTTWAGKYYKAVEARSVPGCVQKPRAPFVIAADGRRSIALAAQFGEGWVTGGVQTDNLSEWWNSIAQAMAHFEESVSAAGNDFAATHRYLSLDAAPTYSLTSPAYFLEAAKTAEELGFTDIVTHWPRPDGWYKGDEAILEKVVQDVLPMLQPSS